jgi:ADP-ribose pyrophosphatase
MDDAAGDEAAPGLGFGDVTVESHEVGYQGYFRVDRYRLRHRLFAGGWSAVVGREVFERGQAVACVLYDADQDRLVLIEQFRAGAFAAGYTGQIADIASPWLIEIVAGIIGAGERPEDVVRREAMEEAGCTVRALEPICRIFATPGAGSETVALYFAQVTAPPAGTLHGLDAEHEDIRLHLVTPEDAFAWIAAGRIVNGPAIIGLQWFQLNAPRLRRQP